MTESPHDPLLLEPTTLGKLLLLNMDGQRKNRNTVSLHSYIPLMTHL